MQKITKQFATLSEAINFVRILKKYSDTVKMKSKGNIYIYLQLKIKIMKDIEIIKEELTSFWKTV